MTPKPEGPRREKDLAAEDFEVFPPGGIGLPDLELDCQEIINLYK